MKRFLSAILATILLCGSLTACGGDTIGENNGVTTELIDETTTPETSVVIETTSELDTEVTEVIPEIPEHQTLTILSNNNIEWLVDSLTTCFTAKYPDIDINIIEMDNNRVNDYTAKLNEMLEKGEGPDIFLICEETIYNTNQYVYSDILADIDKLNDIYGYLDFNDYNEVVMNYGIHKGIRNVFPIFYTIPTLIGIEEVLLKENIKYGNGITFKEFADSLCKSELGHFGNSLWFDIYYRFSGLNLILDENKHYDINNNVFKTLVESHEALFPLSANNPAYKTDKKYESSIAGALLAEDVIFQNFGRLRNYYCTLLSRQTLIQEIINSERTPVITYIPSYDGNKVVADVNYSLAINAKTEYPEAALRFLQYSASFEYMLDDTVYYKSKPITVNTQYIEAEKNAYYGFTVDLPEDYPINYFYKRFAPLPTDVIDSYYKMLDNIYVPEYASMRAVTNLLDSMIYYEKQNCDFEKFVSEAERRLGNYFAD